MALNIVPTYITICYYIIFFQNINNSLFLIPGMPFPEWIYAKLLPIGEDRNPPGMPKGSVADGQTPIAVQRFGLNPAVTDPL